MDSIKFDVKYTTIYQRYVFSVFGVGGGIFLFYGFSYNYHKFIHESIGIQILMLLAPIFGFMLFFMGFFSFVDLWRVAVRVDLTEDEIVGKSYFGGHTWSMKYADIESIIRPKGMFSIFNKGGAMHINAFSGKTLCIGTDVEDFGRCMEVLKKRAVNVKKVDFGEWPGNPSVWE